MYNLLEKVKFKDLLNRIYSFSKSKWHSFMILIEYGDRCGYLGIDVDTYFPKNF